MKRPDPYEEKYGAPDWCYDAQPDGRKVITSILEDFRANPDQYLSNICFRDEQTGEFHHIDAALDHGWPFAATLHDHADHTNLRVHWWAVGKGYMCDFKLTTGFITAGEEVPVPELAFTLLKSGVYDLEVTAERAAEDYLQARIHPCPCANERVDMWWSLTGRVDQTMFHLTLMPEARHWMQLS
jgi:hypothetical protein